MDHVSHASELVARIDAQLAELENERQVVLRVLGAMQPDYDAARTGGTDAYSAALKKLAKGEADAAHRELTEVRDKLEESRVRLLAQSIEKSLGQIERTVTSPLWLGERGNYLQVTDRIQRETRELIGGSGTESPPLLVGHLNALAALQKQLAMDERHLRSRLPIQVFLWGLPIVIGFWASDKFTTHQNVAFLVALLVVSVVVHLVLRFRVLSKLTPVRGLRSVLRTSPERAFVYVQIPILLLGMAFALAPAIDDFVTARKMVLVTGAIPTAVSPGATVRIPYQVSYNDDSVATGVQVSVEVPGLGRCFKEFSALARGRAASDECVLTVAANATPGTYGIEIRVFYTARRWLPMPGVSEYRLRTMGRLLSLTVGAA